MDFRKVEDIFSKWAREADLLVQTEYKGEEVRSADIFDGNQQKWQLWLVPVNESNECVIHYWNYNDICRHSKVNNRELFSKLREIGEIIKSGSV